LSGPDLVAKVDPGYVFCFVYSRIGIPTNLLLSALCERVRSPTVREGNLRERPSLTVGLLTRCSFSA